MDQNRHHMARIFLVDDEPANLKLLERTLRSHGYEALLPIGDPREVVGWYETVRPDLIVLDLRMPHLDGFEVMQQLQALEDPLLPPILVLTAQGGQDQRLRALAAGARDFLGKPFDGSELVARARNLLDAQLAQRMLNDQKAVLQRIVRERTEDLYRTRLAITRRLSMAAEYRDEETGDHILRMSQTCAILAQAIGWDDGQRDLMLNASPMHDVGKIGIPDEILLKPGGFEPHEWEIMKRHTEIGSRLLDGDDSTLMQMACEIAHTHHEKWDGSGYPRGLAGEAIPISGRIAAVADVFDALTSERPYKRAWSIDAAVDRIRASSGMHFDPQLVEAFLQRLPEITRLREQFPDRSGERIRA